MIPVLADDHREPNASPPDVAGFDAAGLLAVLGENDEVDVA